MCNMNEDKKTEPLVGQSPCDAHIQSLPQPAAIADSAASTNGAPVFKCSDSFPAWKRCLDVTCLLLSAPCWLLVMALVSLWLKLVSPGPILYRQQRVGHRGRLFTLLKFRSMRIDVETQSHETHFAHLICSNSPMTKLDAFGDARLVPGGRLLRASGLDELPQLFNVVCGEMSLVGPRPGTPREFALYQASQQARVDAPPGLTGYWQVNGKNKTTFAQMIALDLFYIKHMSFWLDVSIILKTASAVASQLLDAQSGIRRSKRKDQFSVKQ